MRGKIVMPFLILFISKVLFSFELRVVPFSPSITEAEMLSLADKVTSASIRYYLSRPHGVKSLFEFYDSIKENFIALNYSEVSTTCTSALRTASSHLRDVAEWETLHKILRFCAVTYFGMRESAKLDQVLWVLIRWFPDDNFSGKNIPPDLRLRWKKLRGEIPFYLVKFSSPVSGVTLEVDGRVVRGEEVKLPQGPHQIYWHTSYESDVFVKDIYAPIEIKLTPIPLDLTLLRSIVMEKGWCSRKIRDLFDYYSGESPLLFYSPDLQDRYALVDPVVKGVIIHGGDEVIPRLNEILEKMSSIEYVPPLSCSWKNPPFYKTWWFYMGIGILTGGGGYGGYYLWKRDRSENTGVILSW